MESNPDQWDFECRGRWELINNQLMSATDVDWNDGGKLSTLPDMKGFKMCYPLMSFYIVERSLELVRFVIIIYGERLGYSLSLLVPSAESTVI